METLPRRRYSAFRKVLAAPFRWILAPLLDKNRLERASQLEELHAEMDTTIRKMLKSLPAATVSSPSSAAPAPAAPTVDYGKAIEELRGLVQRTAAEIFFARFRDNWNRTGSREEYFNHFLLLQCDNLELIPYWGINLGDYVQARAVQGMMERIAPDIPRSFTERGALSLYEGQKAFVVMQGWFSHGIHFFPNDRIWPVFVGFHVTKETQNTILTFLRFNPNYFNGHSIGCRDRETLEFCRHAGLDAYFSRCFTMTYPRRTKTPKKKKIFLVDVPWYIKRKLPADILENAEIVEQRRSQEFDRDLPRYFNSADYYMKQSGDLLDRYRDEATLIVTTAVHCASPCTAMGIPVVLFNVGGEEATRRFDFLSDVINIWTVEDLEAGKVDWNPQAPDIEALKADMQLNLKLTIEHERTGVEPPELAAVRQRILTPRR